jgi:hypothetical protein
MDPITNTVNQSHPLRSDCVALLVNHLYLAMSHNTCPDDHSCIMQGVVESRVLLENKIFIHLLHSPLSGLFLAFSSLNGFVLLVYDLVCIACQLAEAFNIDCNTS